MSLWLLLILRKVVLFCFFLFAAPIVSGKIMFSLDFVML